MSQYNRIVSFRKSPAELTRVSAAQLDVDFLFCARTFFLRCCCKCCELENMYFNT